MGSRVSGIHFDDEPGVVVTARGNTLRLTGHVSSIKRRQEIERAARGLVPAASVDNELIIQPSR